jgi:hypothetical protein
LNNYFNSLGSNGLKFWSGLPFKVYFVVGVGKVQHMDQVWLVACFYTTCKLGMVSPF